MLGLGEQCPVLSVERIVLSIGSGPSQSFYCLNASLLDRVCTFSFAVYLRRTAGPAIALDLPEWGFILMRATWRTTKRLFPRSPPQNWNPVTYTPSQRPPARTHIKRVCLC